MSGSIAEQIQTNNKHYIYGQNKRIQELPEKEDIRYRICIKYYDDICDARWDGEYFWARVNEFVTETKIDPFWVVWWEEHYDN